MITWLQQHKIIVLIILLTILSGAIRFSILATPDQLVGDEFYFVNFARDYIDGELYYDVHPPLGKMFIAIGIDIFGDTPFGWRAASAFFGTLLIPLLFWFGLVVFRRQGLGLILALLGAADGLLFVISRVGVMDSALMFFLFLGYTLLLLSIRDDRPRFELMLLAGLSFGLAISIKWVALVFIIVVGLLFVSTDLFGWRLSAPPRLVKRLAMAVAYIILPAMIIYLLVWLVHFYLAGVASGDWWRYFGIFNFKIFDYHTHITDTSALASPWWSWPLLLKPWQYFYSHDSGLTRIISAVGTPIIWWSALVAFGPAIIKKIKHHKALLLIAIMFLIHWLPFALIDRPMFNYHFLMAWVLFIVPLAVLLHETWRRSKIGQGLVVIFFVAVVVNIFLFWPIWNGATLNQEALEFRTWLPEWHRGP